MMPHTDGFGVLLAVRKLPRTSLTPFIFLTAKAGGQDIRLGMSEGADDYITKPFDPEALLASARQRLARRRLQLIEAERRATDTGLLAAAALPRELDGCLAQIETISDVLAAKYASDPQSSEMRTALREEVRRLRTLSQRLRLYGELPSLYARRFSAGATPPGCCSHEMTAEIARTVAKRWARSEDLTIAVPAGSAPLSGDAVTILVSELVENSCKFSERATPISVGVSVEPAYWKLTVDDRGRGMAPPEVNAIGAFQQFWSGSERPSGLGLGLVLVQALARLHSGEFQIESESKVGTRVSVMVPVE